MNENNCINFLSNFIFYYSQYKNNLLKYLKDFILEKENIINEINKGKEKLAPKINIINLLEASRIEYQIVFYYLISLIHLSKKII